MWTFNVARELFATAGYNVLPSVVPHEDKDMFDLYSKALQDDTQSNRYCMKVHTILKENIKKSKVISTIRDPRDVCLSFKNFMKCDFSHALNAAKNIVDCVAIYEHYSSDYLTFVKYEDVNDRPYNAIKKIDEFLELQTSDADIKCIVEKFSKTNVKNLIAQSTNALETKIQSNKQIDKKEVVGNPTGNYRAFDLKTGFQSGHISGNKTGDWRIQFSKQEKIILEDAVGDFCEKFGYN